MQIDRIFYPTKTLGYGTRVSIWTIGCPHHCQKCANPELGSPHLERDISTQTVLECISPYFPKIDGITITGGEPFLQVNDLLELLSAIRGEAFAGDILVYTGYVMSELNNFGGNYP
ncbi:hypothetical protein FACS1894216_22400 [Synergistales bacterium]|nr:hypothetical protein FACS1894216_22400 [Synergistales bacterium]